MGSGLIRGHEILLYIKDGSNAEPTIRRKCKWDGCKTYLNQARIKKGATYCMIHTYEIASVNIALLPKKYIKRSKDG